jgi:phosphoserine aminotransferase
MYDEIKLEAQKEFMNVRETGHSMFEFNHRSPAYYALQKEAKDNLRKFLSIPDTHTILFFQGGSHLMFNSIGMNLFSRDNPIVNNVCTGFWSFSTEGEQQKMGKIHNVLPHIKKGNLAPANVPEPSAWDVNPNADFVHYCDNETATGFEMTDFPAEIFGDQPIVCDMSSNIGTRQIDWTKHAAVYACAQKNLGPTGVTVLIVRKDLCEKEGLPYCPTSLNWKTAEHSKENIINTPDVAATYMMNLNLKHSLKLGGIPYYEEQAKLKSQVIYNIIDNSDGFYSNHVDPKYRSRINVVFRIGGGDKEIEKNFLAGAKKYNIKYIGGHWSIGGGSRISLYNAMPMEGVQVVANYMREFRD